MPPIQHGSEAPAPREVAVEGKALQLHHMALWIASQLMGLPSARTHAWILA